MDKHNDLTNKIYNELRVILSGCKHISDATEIAIMYKSRYPEYEKLITGLINGKVYENTMSIKNIHSVLIDISLQTYKEDVLDLIDNICDGRIISEPQKRSFLRLSKLKILKPISKVIDIAKKTKVEYEKKECPHCGHICVAPKGTEYIICGYTDPHKGYDMKGCGRDWCFSCGKILCKTWDKNTLFLESNRYHDGDCCMDHAKKHGKMYNKDYCHCINTNVNRDNIPYKMGIMLS